MLSDDVAAFLPELQAQAESMMTDTVRLERPTGTTSDPDTLEDAATYQTVYEGPGRWQRPGTQGSEPVVGEAEYGLNRVTVQLPISVLVAARGQRATCVASATDPALAGAAATVLAVANKTHSTMRRLLCEEVT